MNINNVIYFPGVKASITHTHSKCDKLIRGGGYKSNKMLDVVKPENAIRRFFRMYEHLSLVEDNVQLKRMDIKILKEMQFETLTKGSFFNALKMANIQSTGSAQCDLCSHVSPFHFSQYFEMSLQSLLRNILWTAEDLEFDFDDMFLSENPNLIRGQAEWVRFMYERYFDMYPDDYKDFLKSTYNETGYEDWKHIKDNECHWHEFQRFKPVITDGVVEDNGFRRLQYMIERLDLVWLKTLIPNPLHAGFFSLVKNTHFLHISNI